MRTPLRVLVDNSSEYILFEMDRDYEKKYDLSLREDLNAYVLADMAGQYKEYNKKTLYTILS